MNNVIKVSGLTLYYKLQLASWPLEGLNHTIDLVNQSLGLMNEMFSLKDILPLYYGSAHRAMFHLCFRNYQRR